MKAIGKYLALAILVYFMVKCNSDTTPTPEPVVIFTEAYALPSSIPYAGSAILYWNSKNVISVTKDGTPLSTTSGSENLESLTKDTSFTLIFKGVDGQLITKSVQIKVEAKPIPTRTDSICAKVWRLTEEKAWVNDKEWVYLILSEAELRDELHFYPNWNLKSFDPIDNRLTGDCNWSWISKDSILIGSDRLRYKLTSDSFVRSGRNGTIILTYKAMP